MGSHFILVGLLCFCGLSLSYECRRELLLNVEFTGSNIKAVYSPDAEHCQHLCTHHPSCHFFSFLQADWTKDKRFFYCYLKFSPSGQPKVRKPVLGITSGFSLKRCRPDPLPCLPQVYHNVDFYGADYRSLFTADYEECQRACTHDPACQFFTFLENVFANRKFRYKCYLKFSWTIPRIPKIIHHAKTISGFSHSMQATQNNGPACEVKLFPGTDTVMPLIGSLPAVSPEGCQALCSAHPQCTHFTFNSYNFGCYLKNSPNQMVLNAVQRLTSGLPARFCQLDNKWIKRTYGGFNFLGSHIRSFSTRVVETCQRTCTEDPNCQFYTYNTHSRRCFLKRVITMPAPPTVRKFTNAVSGFSLKNCFYKASF